MLHPAQVLFDSSAPLAKVLAACDHYAGTPERMQKALALQQNFGYALDLTFDCEDGAPAGNEQAHALQIAALINSTDNLYDRIGVRVHDPHHSAFVQDLQILIQQAGKRIAYITLPKIKSTVELNNAIALINQISDFASIGKSIPIHVLVETPSALQEVYAIASITQVECLSFGLMDYVSSYEGNIPATAMTSPAQFEHPLVARAMIDIALACHTYGKVASHNVSTDIAHPEKAGEDALRAKKEFAYTRKWSIHPSQIQPILAAFTPNIEEIDQAIAILLSAQTAAWGPIKLDGVLHDRASYRYYWKILTQAQQHLRILPVSVQDRLKNTYFFQ